VAVVVRVVCRPSYTSHCGRRTYCMAAAVQWAGCRNGWSI